MSDPTAPVEGTTASSTPAPDTAPSAPQDAFAPVLDRVNELASTIDTRFATIEGRLPQPEQTPDPDPWAALENLGQPEQAAPQYFDAYGNPVELPQQPQGLDVAALRQAYQADLQQALTPYQQHMQQMQAEQADTRLGQMIPALANTPENAANRTQAFELVSQALQNYPAALANQLAADPNFIGTMWKAAEADRLAAGQVPASATTPTLESAGGATPGGAIENPIDQAFPAQRKALAPGFY